MRSILFDPGRMTARLELEVPVETPDGQGGATVAFEAAASLWALIEPVSFTPIEEAAGRSFTLTHRVWLRWRSDIVPGMRLRKGARIFWIGATQDPDETRRYLICHCEEKGP